MKITIIGAGSIGGAIAKGLAKGNMFKASDITCTAQSQATLDKMKAANPDFVLSLNNIEAVKGADIIIIAVKPWRVEEIIDQIKGVLDYDKQIIVSVAAGITFDTLNSYLTKNTSYEDWVTPALFRIMPNTAIEVLSSMTFVSAHNATPEQSELIINIFNELGNVGRRTPDGCRYCIGFQRYRFRSSLYPCCYRRRCRTGFLSEAGTGNRCPYRKRGYRPVISKQE